MTADPLGGNVTDPQSLNRYAYATNRPATLVDPSGMDNCIQGRGAGRYVSCQNGGNTGQDDSGSVAWLGGSGGGGSGGYGLNGGGGCLLDGTAAPCSMVMPLVASGTAVDMDYTMLQFTGGISVLGSDYDPNDSTNPTISFATDGSMYVEDYNYDPSEVDMGASAVGTYEEEITSGLLMEVMGYGGGQLAEGEFKSAALNMAATHGAYTGSLFAPRIGSTMLTVGNAFSNLSQMTEEFGSSLYYDPEFIENAAEFLDSWDPAFSVPKTVAGKIGFVVSLFWGP